MIKEFQEFKFGCKCVELKAKNEELEKLLQELQSGFDSPNASIILEGDLVEKLYLQKQIALEENVLIKAVVEVKGEKPMSYTNVFKFFEQLMELKLKQDREDVLAKVKPRTMPNFLYDYLMQQYGIRTLANKQLSQLLLALKQLYDEKQTYGTLFCRLLQVYHPDPIDLICCCLLLRLRIEFNKMLELFQRRRQQVGRKVEAYTPVKVKTPKKFVGDLDSTPRRLQVESEKEEEMEQQKIELGKQMLDSYGKKQYEQESVGGQIPLIEVYILIYKIFESDREFGQQVCSRLQPSHRKIDFLMYVIVYKMSRLGKTPHQIFASIDQDSGGEISKEEFVAGIQNQLNLSLSMEELDALLNYIDADQNGSIEYREFVDKISELSQKKVNKQIWMTSRAEFLIAVADAYDHKKFRDAENISQLFTDYDEDLDEVIQKEEFYQMIEKESQQFLDQNHINNIFLEAKQKSNDEGIKLQAFHYVCLKYSILSFGAKAFEADKILSGVDRGEKEYAEPTIIKALTGKSIMQRRGQKRRSLSPQSAKRLATLRESRHNEN